MLLGLEQTYWFMGVIFSSFEIRDRLVSTFFVVNYMFKVLDKLGRIALFTDYCYSYFIAIILSDIYESETLPDIMQNMTDNLDNILIQLELRGIDTEYTFNFDNISDDIVNDIDNLAGEFPESDWIHKLYANKMDRIIMK